MEELDGLSSTAVIKVNTIRSAKTNSETLYSKVLKDNITPVKKRFGFQISPSPASTTNEEMQILKSELFKHMDDDNAVLDFIKGFVGGIMQSYETVSDEKSTFNIQLNLTLTQPTNLLP